MKTTKIIFLIIVIVAGSSFVELSAQEKIRSLIETYEDSKGIGKKLTVRYSENYGDIEYIEKTLYINNNKNLVNIFIQAFVEEKEKSFNTFEKSTDGRLIASDYHFYDTCFNANCRFISSEPSSIEVTYIGKKTK